MKLRLTFIALIGALGFLAGCSSSSEQPVDPNGYRAVTVNERYSMQVPNYLDTTSTLNSDASAQFQNVEAQVCLMVIENEKAQMDTNYNLNRFYTEVKTNFGAEFNASAELTVNGLSVIQAEVTDTVERRVVHYSIAVIEGASHFYQIISWLPKSKAVEYDPVFDHILGSFEELQAGDSA